MPDVLVLDVDTSQEQEDSLQRIFHLQQESVGSFDTVCLTGLRRGIPLVTEYSKPVGSGSIIYLSFEYY